MKGVVKLQEQLKANQGKKVVLELVNGRIIPGTVIAVDQQFVRFGTDEGVGMIPVNAVQIIWEPAKRSITEENMEDVAEKLRDSVKAEIACTGFDFTCTQRYICRPPDICTGAFSCPFSYVPFQGGSQCPVAFACPGTQFFGIQCFPPAFASQAVESDVQAEIACTGFPGFSCLHSYICRPPDTCTFSFACPGRYVPSFPSGGGGCPTFFCGPFQFGQPCATFPVGQPCGPFPFGHPCATFPVGQPCRPFQFGHPCATFPVGQPCRPFPFVPTCGPFQFGGSQCGAPGGFVCPGAQFFGAPTRPPGMVNEPPLPPTGYSVKDDQGKDKQDKKD